MEQRSARLPVTEKVAGSNPVSPATLTSGYKCFNMPENLKGERAAKSVSVRPNVVINGEGGRSSILLPLGDTGLIDNEVLERLAAMGYAPKSEFHVTALDIKTGSALAQAIDALATPDRTALLDFMESVADQGWEITPRPEFYAVERQYADESVPRRSIIQMVDCPPLETFYAGFNERLPAEATAEVPPAHVTLAVQGSPRGIGLTSAQDLLTYGKPLLLG